MVRSTPVSIPHHEPHWSNTHRNTHRTSSDASLTGPVCASPPPMSAWINPSTSVLHTGQLSPVSPGRDSASSASSRVNSASLSYTDTSSMEGAIRDDASTPWTEDGGLIPKLEADDEFGGLLDVPAVEMRDLDPEDPGFIDGRDEEMGSRKVGEKPQKKKPRGRPRKHPLAPVGGTNKVAKPRSKTGCITCRKRKKKCDEARPRCMNCEKNAVVCEGYHEKQIWKSGKEKAEEARLRRISLPAITMPPIFHGVEAPEDKIFWWHYCNHLSNVLTVESEHRNAFKGIVLRLATRHQGLMHSVLSLSAGHIDYETPYGTKILRDGASREVTLSSLRERAEFHHEEAMKCLYADMRRSEDPADSGYKTVLTARYGQMLCLLLKTIVEGNPRGEHRVHLQAYRSLMRHSPPEDPDFRAFITEFFEYHLFADELLSPPGPEGRMAEYPASSPSLSPQLPRLIGVRDGLFTYMSQITAIRDTIRENIRSGADHAVDYPSLYRAAEIDAAVRDWLSCWPAGDSRDRVALLYKQAVWVYLFRTIYPPYERRGQRGDGTGCSVSSSTSSECEFEAGGENVSGTSASDGTPTPSPSSPPTRTPDLQDPRITTTLNESLALLETFKPSDPSQRLLLIPCLLLGTACFNPAQQERVRKAVGRVRGYTGLRNCDLLAEMLEGVWGAMGRGEWWEVWEWEGVAGRMGIDFLCA